MSSEMHEVRQMEPYVAPEERRAALAARRAQEEAEDEALRARLDSFSSDALDYVQRYDWDKNDDTSLRRRREVEAMLIEHGASRAQAERLVGTAHPDAR